MSRGGGGVGEEESPGVLGSRSHEDKCVKATWIITQMILEDLKYNFIFIPSLLDLFYILHSILSPNEYVVYFS